MLVFRLTKTLTETQDPDWEDLVDLTLGAGAHPDRKRGFLLSRKALQACFKEAGFEVSASDLKLVEHRQVLSHPQFTISLSHTKSWGAALLGDLQTFRSLGVDIEPTDRVVKDSILGRIIHPDDFSLRGIELWCLKEAVFKAIMNTGLFKTPVEFSSIQLHEKYWSHSPSGLAGEWDLETRPELTVARAFLKN